MSASLQEDEDSIYHLGVGPSHLDSSNVSTSSSSFQTNGVRNRATSTVNSHLGEDSSELLKMRRLSRGRSEDEMLPVLEPFDLEKYPIREIKFRIPGLVDPIVINPMVTLVAVALLWGVVIYTIVDPENSLQNLIQLKSSISLYFTWLFVGSKAAFFFFLMWIMYRYGHLKLGQKEDEPEFTTFTYFCIIFATGVASGFFVFSVAEPLWHQKSHFYAAAGYRSQDEIDMFAINMTVHNWGITGWTGYTVVAICMSLATHRFKLPRTARSCFYPLLRHYTWGWIGDCIDGLSIIITVSGVCTSLGLGAIEIVTGLLYLGWVDEYSREDYVTGIETTAVWVITIACTASAISGVHGGIRLLSLTACYCGLFILCVIFFMDDSKFLMNLMVQEVGYFMQYNVFLLNFWTDAFGQLREGSGRAVDGKSAEVWWMDAWSIFYICWWFSWAIFVGSMIARVSRGRKLWELIFYSFIAPTAACLVWFCIWGGIGLRQSRQAMELEILGKTYFNNSNAYLVPGSEVCYEVPQEDVVVDGEVVFTNYLPGVTPVCQFDSDESSTASFNVLFSFSFPESFPGSGYGPVLSVFYITFLTLFFVTSMDSSSLIVDHIASNGSHSHHWIRRMFWAVTHGALATALLSSGGSTALRAVQAASVICGLPCVILLLYIMQCVFLFCHAAEKLTNDECYEFPDQPEFSMPVYGGIFNIMEFASTFGNVHKSRIELGIDVPTSPQCIEFIRGLLVPFISMYQVLSFAYPTRLCVNAVAASVYGLCYIGWITMFSLSRSHPGLLAWAGTSFFVCGALMGKIRSRFRSKYNIQGNNAADFLTGLILWPQVLAQMRLHCLALLRDKAKPDEALPNTLNCDVEDSQSLSSS